jgi:S1-C subfamily serine protease
MRPTCPICRETVVMIRPHTSCSNSKFLVLTHGHAGVTIANTPGGVIVTKVTAKDMAFMGGLRRGDIITHMNGIPTVKHENAVQIIERARAIGTVLECAVQEAKLPPWRIRLLRAFRSRRLSMVV